MSAPHGGIARGEGEGKPAPAPLGAAADSLSLPQLLTDVPRRRWAPEGRTQRVALVPTMGSLHEGHLSLMRAARAHADQVVVSIFVNPLQFGPKEDFDEYPRDLKGDLQRCAEAGVDVVFHPKEVAFYPVGFQTHIDVTAVSQGLCGARRPGHFRGVATVVYRLLQLLQPDVALFGEKDFQQLRVIQRMTADLGLPIEILSAPIVREADGLAMSSRNRYLSPADRQRAVALSRGLRAAQARFAQGERSAETLRETARQALREVELLEDYVELCDPETLRPVPYAEKDSRLLVAAFAGATRLIDNAAIGG